MKPIVGVMPLWDEEKESLWMLPEYLDAIRLSGGIPVIFPFQHTEQDLRRLMDRCDGFLLTGGPDVSPELYHEKPLNDLVQCCPRRDELESFVLREAVRAGKPVLGICRGLQLINVVLGGSLYQDLPLQHPSETNHHGHAPYHQPVHEVELSEGAPLFECLGCRRLPVNSLHHQAIKKLSPLLRETAVSPDGLTEAVCMPGGDFLWAVQWHPEYSFRTDENSRKIFTAFIKAMERAPRTF